MYESIVTDIVERLRKMRFCSHNVDWWGGFDIYPLNCTAKQLRKEILLKLYWPSNQRFCVTKVVDSGSPFNVSLLHNCIQHYQKTRQSYMPYTSSKLRTGKFTLYFCGTNFTTFTKFSLLDGMMLTRNCTVQLTNISIFSKVLLIFSLLCNERS